MLFFLDYTLVWIGLTDLRDEDQYVYTSSGLRPLYSNWDNGEPGGKTTENCAVLPTKERKWHDFPCSFIMSYVCKKPAKHFV